jgi:hypothetical protein
MTLARTLRVVSVLTTIAATFILAGGPSVAAQRSALPEHFHALAVQMGASPGQVSVPIDLTVTRWSTPSERDTVMSTILEQPKKLVEVLQKMPSVGRLSGVGDVGYDLRYAENTSSGGTDRIVLMTDRPVGFAEAQDSGRTLDYRITVIELRVGSNGKGEGKVAVAAKLTTDRKTKQLTVEDWNISPVRLQSLERDKK